MMRLFLTEQRPAIPGVVFSINIPKASEAEIGGVTVGEMGECYLRFAYEESQEEGEIRGFSPRLALEINLTDGSDTEVFMRDIITITPLQFDWTAHSAMDQLKGWELSHEVPRQDGTPAN